MVSAFIQQRPGEVTVHAPQQFYAGDTWEIEAQCNDAAGLPIDLSGATVTWVLNSADDLAENELVLGVGDGISLEENTSGDLIVGMCLIRVSHTRTAPIVPGFYFDELTVVTAGDEASTQFRGRIEVLPKLTGPITGGVSGG